MEPLLSRSIDIVDHFLHIDHLHVQNVVNLKNVILFYQQELLEL